MGTFKRSVRAVLAGSLVLGGALAGLVIGGAQPASAAQVIQTITVGNDPVGVSSDGTHVWVVNAGDGTVTELDASTGSEIDTSPVAVNGPQGISSDGTHVWVLDSSDNTVSELDASTGSVIQTITVGSLPDGVSSDGTHVWVANYIGGTLSELSASTGSVIQTITVGTKPTAVSSDGTHVWVVNGGDGTVSELSASTGSVIQTITVGSTPFAVSSDGTHVWLTSGGGGDTVTELSASTGSVIQTITVGALPDAISSDGTHVWVANRNDNTVSEIALTPPTTSVALPSNGASLSGGQYLDATASSGVTKVEFHLTGGTLNDALIGTATITYYGWIAGWDTTTVPNGTYTLQSVAYYAGGVSGRSAGITVTVNNPPPSTSVRIPSDGATMAGSQYLGASASSGVSKVEFHLTGGTLNDASIGTATPFQYGWIAGWDTTTVPDGTYTLQSVAYYAGDVSGTSAGITITVAN